MIQRKTAAFIPPVTMDFTVFKQPWVLYLVLLKITQIQDRSLFRREFYCRKYSAELRDATIHI